MSSLAAAGANPDFDPLATQSGWRNVQRGTFDQVGAGVADTLLNTPIGAINRTAEIFWANVGDTKPITEENFRKSYGDLGVRWHRGMSEQTAAIIAERKKREIERGFVMAAGPDTGLSKTVVFSASFLANFLDPINVAMSFVPVVGQAKWAQLSARLATAGKATTITQKLMKARTALNLVSEVKPGLFSVPGLFQRAAGGSTLSRATIGTIEGIVGTALTEPLVLGASALDQSDYDSADSVHSILIGGLLGGTLHAGLGKVGDFFTARGKKIVEAELRQAHTAALQLVDGKSVDVSGIKTSFDAEIKIATVDGDPHIGAPQTSIDLDVDFGTLPNIELTKTKDGFTAKFEGDSGTHFTSFAKSAKQARVDLMTSYESARIARQQERINQKAFGNKTDIEFQENKINNLVDKRNQLKSAIKGETVGPKDLAKLKSQLEALNSPEAFELKLQKLGFPMDSLALQREAIDIIKREIDTLAPRRSQQAARKKIKRLNEELVAARQELSERVNALDERDIFASAKEQLKIERQQLRDKMKGISDTPKQDLKSELKKVNQEIELTKNELDRLGFEQVRDNLIDQETNWKRDAFPLEPKEDLPGNDINVTNERGVELLDAEIKELEADAAKLSDETLENTKNPDIIAEREAIKLDMIRSEAVTAGVNCMAQIGIQ